MSGSDVKLGVSVGAQDIVYLEIGGELNADALSRFKEWTFKVRETIKAQFDKTGQKVLCLVDISGLLKYDPQVLIELASLMKTNEPFVLRTATFGGSSYMIMAEDVVIALSGRKNLKAFSKKEDALEWLTTGEAKAE